MIGIGGYSKIKAYEVDIIRKTKYGKWYEDLVYSEASDLSIEEFEKKIIKENNISEYDILKIKPTKIIIQKEWDDISRINYWADK